MQNIKKVLSIIKALQREVNKLRVEDIEEAMPSDTEEVINILYEIGDEISKIIKVLFPLRERVISKRIKFESQQKEKAH